jgi:hypothetical protein
LPVISARDLYLAGGRDGDNIERWYVSGSDHGAFDVFLRNAGSPTSYSNDGLSFDIVDGGVPFAKGDGWKFSIEGGHYRWRKDGGSWSLPVDIPPVSVGLVDGLSIEFTTGASPSFVAGDLYSFTALQPWAASNLQTPTLEAWAWTGATANIVFDCGALVDFEGFVIGFHTLPNTATIVVEGGASSGVYTWSETLTWREGAIAKEFATTQAARYVRLSLTGATDGTIGWVWGGAFFKTVRTADIDLRRAYKINRAQNSGLNQRGLYLGKTISGTVEYTEGSLTEADAAGLQALLDHVKANDDEPFVLIPQITRPEEVIVASILSDEVDFADVYRYGLNAGRERKFSAVLPLQGVWQ